MTAVEIPESEIKSQIFDLIDEFYQLSQPYLRMLYQLAMVKLPIGVLHEDGKFEILHPKDTPEETEIKLELEKIKLNYQTKINEIYSVKNDTKASSLFSGLPPDGTTACASIPSAFEFRTACEFYLSRFYSNQG